MTCGTALLMALTKATGSLSASWMTWACWPLASSARLSSTREGGPQATKWPSPAIPHLRVCFLLRLFMSNFFLLLLFLSLLWTSSFSLCLHLSGFHFGRRVGARACSVFMDLCDQQKCFSDGTEQGQQRPLLNRGF